MREGVFDITFRVFTHGRWPWSEFNVMSQPPSSNNFDIQFTLSIPYEASHQYDLTGDFMTHIHQDLTYDEIQELASEIMSKFQALLRDHSSNHQFPPLIVNIHVFSATPPTNSDLLEEILDERVVEDSLEEIVVDRVVEESMQQVYMVPATEKAVASLEKVEVISGEVKAAERCSICMEDFEKDDDDISRMPYLDIIERVTEESMQHRNTVPATEKAMASLEKVKVFNGETCSICLENFEEEEEVSRMPCQHIYHENCIVAWLKTSHMCPLCRFKMLMT
ncbi:E3 ubiquitin-protein ligase RING1-like [Senna tora]|uniref:RING-type E3 ubiquitin transferase n=1 Tax=Senna tora TaxID=362788 RepID=A0A834T524_9FABA|nr:E3 ubiquitin-protein ligase RING1-like [Senna tora]